MIYFLSLFLLHFVTFCFYHYTNFSNSHVIKGCHFYGNITKSSPATPRWCTSFEVKKRSYLYAFPSGCKSHDGVSVWLLLCSECKMTSLIQICIITRINHNLICCVTLAKSAGLAATYGGFICSIHFLISILARRRELLISVFPQMSNCYML